MKRNDLLSMTIDLVLAWIMALAGVFCLATGFHMAVDISYVALTALFFALLAVVSARIKHGWLLLLLGIMAIRVFNKAEKSYQEQSAAPAQPYNGTYGQ